MFLFSASRVMIAKTSEPEYFLITSLSARADDDCDVVALVIGSNQLVKEKCISRATADEVLKRLQVLCKSEKWQRHWNGAASPSIFILKPLDDFLLTSNWARAQFICWRVESRTFPRHNLWLNLGHPTGWEQAKGKGIFDRLPTHYTAIWSLRRTIT